MILLRMFFVFEGLWQKFFGALKAWIRRVSPICGLLRFLEAFELDSNDLWDLGRWFGWFLFECSLYSKLKFLEASKLGSNRVSGLLNLDLLQLVGGWATRDEVWWVTHVIAWLVCLCHRLHALDCLCHRLHVRGCLCHRLHVGGGLCHHLHVRWCVIGFLHDTWKISIGFWVVITKSSNSTRCFAICCILWTW